MFTDQLVELGRLLDQVVGDVDHEGHPAVPQRRDRSHDDLQGYVGWSSLPCHGPGKKSSKPSRPASVAISLSFSCNTARSLSKRACSFSVTSRAITASIPGASGV